MNNFSQSDYLRHYDAFSDFDYCKSLLIKQPKNLATWRPEKLPLMLMAYLKNSSFQPYMVKRHKERHHNKTIKYSCDQCDYYTYDKGAIKVHKNRIHVRRCDFSCSECDKSFPKRNALAKHLMAMHSIVYQWK